MPNRRFLPMLAACLLLTCAPGPGRAATAGDGTVRVATYNVRELGRDKLDQVDAAGHGSNLQLRHAAAVVQTVRPDVLLLNEIDFDPAGENAQLFVERYLRIGQEGHDGIDYPYVFFEPVNTGVPSGHDFDRDGVTTSPEDAYGFGHYPGQYGMALLSRFPLDVHAARTFRLLRWQDQPGNLLPDGQHGKPAWYGPREVAILRLSSKSHWDVPVRIGDRTLHLLASHPTPPVFDGDEDRNGRRNFDEVRLWADYLTGGSAAAYLVDDSGGRGGLDPQASFVLLGDLNADPYNDLAPYGRTAISQLLEHPRVADPTPRGAGGRSVTREYSGPPNIRTSSYGRLDFVLPSRDLTVTGSGIFWPAAGEPGAALVTGDDAASDHYLVWVDLALAPAATRN